ncbi:hypothetical protein [Sorangium sp. So ce693]|uniref:hypothetical protein n=1 Tax=Sorangium sp. So ce693 TaxID=3133318 RepID=UPI003F5FEF1E
MTLAAHEVDHIVALKHGGATHRRISPSLASCATSTEGLISHPSMWRPGSSRAARARRRPPWE